MVGQRIPSMGSLVGYALNHIHDTEEVVVDTGVHETNCNDPEGTIQRFLGA